MDLVAERAALPPLTRNGSFLSFLGTQALGALNDNVFKQVVMLLAVGMTVANLGIEYQAMINFFFALPFILFSGLAGDLSDRRSKGAIMVLCKVAEVTVMIAGLAVFLGAAGLDRSTRDVLPLLCVVVFLMGTQSAFFGPPKYGGIPELVRDKDLPAATGLTQMTTFLSIILGVALGGALFDHWRGRLHLSAGVAVGIAIVGTLTALGIRRWPAANPRQRVGWRSLLSVFPTLARVRREDRLLLFVMLLYGWFWLVGGVCLPAINDLGMLQLGLTGLKTSLMVSMLSLGIAMGSLAAGLLSRGRVRLGLIVPGGVALVVSLLAVPLVPVHAPTADELARYAQIKHLPPTEQPAIFPEASGGTLVATYALALAIGASAGFFSLPLLSFIQARPASGQKGQVFAATNWLNWCFILVSAGMYGLGAFLTRNQGNLVVAGMGGLTVIVGLILVPIIIGKCRTEARG
jgi:MFS family permease